MSLDVGSYASCFSVLALGEPFVAVIPESWRVPNPSGSSDELAPTLFRRTQVL